MNRVGDMELGSEPQIKGLAFHSILSALESLRGPDARARALAGAPGVVSERLSRGDIVASGWYPISLYRDLWRGFDELGEGEGLASLIGAESVEADLKSVHRMLLRLMSPNTIMSVSSRMFGRYFDTGGVKVESAEDRYLRIRWHDCRGWSRNMWVEQMAGSRRILQLSGAKSVRVTVLSGAQDGDDFAVTEGRWR